MNWILVTGIILKTVAKDTGGRTITRTKKQAAAQRMRWDLLSTTDSVWFQHPRKSLTFLPLTYSEKTVFHSTVFGTTETEPSQQTLSSALNTVPPEQSFSGRWRSFPVTGIHLVLGSVTCGAESVERCVCVSEDVQMEEWEKQGQSCFQTPVPCHSGS